MSPCWKHSLALGLLFAVWACKDTRSFVVDDDDSSLRRASPSRTVDLGYQPVSSAGLIISAICHDTLLFRELDSMGWNLVCVPLRKSGQVATGIQEGWLDAGVDFAERTLDMCAGGTVRVLSLVDQSYSTILTKHPIPMSEMKGLRIGYVPGSGAENYLRNHLRDLGLGEEDVRLVPDNPERLSWLLGRGNIDALAVDEPQASQFLEENQDWQFSMRRLGRSYLVAHILLMENPELVRALLRAQIRQQLELEEKSHRIKAELWRWQAAAEIGAGVPSPKMLKYLADNPTCIGISTSSSLLLGVDFPSTLQACPDTSGYGIALDQFLGGRGQ